MDDPYGNNSSANVEVNEVFEEVCDLCQIEEGLFLGSMEDANKKDALKRSNITHILAVDKALEPSFPNDFVYKIVRVLDKENVYIAQFFDDCFNFINEAKRLKGGVLVHCFGGISRSVTIVVAYLIKERSMKLSQALDYVRRRRPEADPNAGFLLQLLLFEKSLQSIGKPKVDCCSIC
ncbi:hypothetical protein K2173_017601 [Erythroxylum novogranatense]|uniref:Dual specificity protein phosphatase 1 n=1 Tax=Erythroxylum novogranatense TaxID=1862640 RepID=A0AAV8TKV9_9ROSI|nr:hypothetical protein K2173_017601 [Erythroxylum novogranatense]